MNAEFRLAAQPVLDRLHPIQREDVFLLLDSPTLSVFSVEPGVLETVRLYHQGSPLDQALERTGLEVEGFQDSLDKIRASVESRQRGQEKARAMFEEGLRCASYLDTLYVFTTDYCNLSCRYCYEIQNAFQSPQSMTQQVADALIRQIIVNPEIQKGISDAERGMFRVIFFGGEPLLNVPIIEYLCARITREKQRLGFKPGFNVITNGTLINKPILELLSQYRMRVTVSLDGEQHLHDRYRVFKNGRGSYDLVIRNWDTLVAERDRGRIPFIAFEATITRATLTESSMTQTVQHLMTLRPNAVMTAMAAFPPDHPEHLTINQSVTDDEFGAWESILLSSLNEGRFVYHEKLYKLLRAIMTKNIMWNRPCLGGVATYAITAGGDVYPCGPLAGVGEFYMGNVLSDFPGERYFEVKNSILEATHDADVRCSKCWARYLCINMCCYASNYFQARSLTKFSVSEAECSGRRKFMEDFVALYGRLLKTRKAELIRYMKFPGLFPNS